MKNVLTPARIGAAFVVAPAVIVLAGGPALAADSVSVSNTETVQAHLDASGHVRDARVYEQLALQGHGTVTVSDPVSTKNLRNLDGFGGFDVKGANLVANVSVDGERRLRAVSDFTKELPLKVTATYTLDGRKVEPGDVVGRSGLLQVHYVVENITGRDQEVSFDDGTGTKVTRTEKVVIPMVGSLTTVLPSTFTDVHSEEAAIAGDGHGGTQMTFTMTLFGPIGSPRAEFGYAAKVTDGVVPSATVSALPVSPLDSPSFKGGAASYKGGADTGLQLTSGAAQIDSNVLKLRDGAAQLLAGLIKLRDGAKDLNAGLTGKAAPGAAKLASGAGALKSGTGKLASGAKDAKAGSAQLSAGSADLSSGASALADGLHQIRDGVDVLGANPDVKDGVDALKGGLDAVIAGVGSASTPNTLLNGVAQLQGGVGQLQAALDHTPTGVPDPVTHIPDSGGIKQVLTTLLGQLDNASPTSPGAKQALSSIIQGLDNTSGTGQPGLKQALQSLQALLGCPDNVSANPADGFCSGIADVPTALQTKVLLASMKAGLGSQATPGNTALYGLAQIQGKIGDRTTPGQTALFALNQIVNGIGAPGMSNTMLDGLSQMSAGLTRMQLGLSNPGCDPAAETGPKVCGIAQGAGFIKGGVDQLVDGISTSLADQVAGGASQIAGGANQLDSGLSQLKSGAGQLDTGAGQLKSGADQLSAGLGDAATGSGKLADGLATAAGKAPALQDGASRLSAEGTTKLVDAGKGTASDYGLKYALIEAGAQRAKAEGMAYGAPAGATGATAYSLELAGMTGEGSRNVGRGLGAMAVFGLGAGLTVLRRRWL